MSPLTPLSQSQQPSSYSQPRKERMTGAGILISFLLVLALIVLGERGLYDLNRLFNSHYDSCNQAAFLITVGESCPAESFAFHNVLLHSYVSFPLFVIFLILMLYLRNRRLNTWQKALFRVSGVVSIFFGIQFLAEVIIYLMKFHTLVGIYVTLTLAVLLCVILVVYFERRAAKKSLVSQARR